MIARIFHALTLRCLIPPIAVAISIAIVPDVRAAAEAPLPLDLSRYDCSVAPAAAQARHVGQVIGGVYHEWVQTYATSQTGQVVYCVVTSRPTAQQLQKADAAALLAASSSFGLLGSQTSSAASASRHADADVVNTELAASDVSVLPVATQNADATQAETGVPVRTAPQTLMGLGPNDYRVMDGGFGTKSTAKPAIAKARDANVRQAAASGTDDRTRVTDVSVFPMFLIGQLVVTWKDGTQSDCTGTLVSPHVVLTAGQCVHNRERGGFASKALFSPGQNQAGAGTATTQPIGARYADYAETNNRWTQISGGESIQVTDAGSDYGAFYFVQSWGDSATFMPVVYGDTTTASGSIQVAGYPLDVGGTSTTNQGLWTDSGEETAGSISSLRLFQVRQFTNTVSAGENGAPFWTPHNTSPGIVGVVSYGGYQAAGGVWFGGMNQATVTSFVTWTPAKGPPSQSVTANDLKVPNVFASGNTATSSYFRFYNPTLQVGSVVVTITDGVTGAPLGTWTSPALPPLSSDQFSMGAIESGATPAIKGSSWVRYTLAIQANFAGYFQHVIWNVAGQSLTNISSCGNGNSEDVLHLSNVHSTLVGGYPSIVYAHNVGTVSADAVIGVYDAISGKRIGGIRIPSIPPNAAASFQMAEVEAALSYKPTQSHYNLVQEGDFQGYLQHIVNNTGAGVMTNMTEKCAFPVH